jgi:hypothetical protein
MSPRSVAGDDAPRSLLRLSVFEPPGLDLFVIRGG